MKRIQGVRNNMANKTIYIKPEHVETWDTVADLHGNMSQLVTALVDRWLQDQPVCPNCFVHVATNRCAECGAVPEFGVRAKKYNLPIDTPPSTTP